MAEQREVFIKGAQEKGFNQDLASNIFDLMEKFAGYGFNKSHSAAYALLAYQTAYLKANYPAEYIAACLTAVKRDKDRTAIFLSEARNLGVNVSTPDINESLEDFSVSNNEIVFGISAIRNVGDITAEKIINERGNGPFETIEEFLSRIDSRSLNKRGIEAMVQGGAFDRFGFPRKGVFESITDLIEDAKDLKKNGQSSQDSLFELDDSENKTKIQNVEWDKKELLDREREMLGFFVSEDPLEGYGDCLLYTSPSPRDRQKCRMPSSA